MIPVEFSVKSDLPVLNDIYDAIYEDARGRETTQIYNDGQELRISLRGIDFTSTDFDSFEPVPEHLERAQSLFTLDHDRYLWSCRLEWTMPLQLEHNGEICTGALTAALKLDDYVPNGSIDSEMLVLKLKTPVQTLKSSGRSGGWFEDEMEELARELDEGWRIRSCFTCAFGDYGNILGGHGLFGAIACFRDVRAEYQKVKGKGRGEFFSVWVRKTAFVQETYLCEEYQAESS